MYFAISPDLYVPKTWTPNDMLYDVAAVPGEAKAKTVAKPRKAVKTNKPKRFYKPKQSKKEKPSS